MVETRRRPSGRLLAAFVAGLVAACGGGGGSSSSDTVTLSFDTPSISATYYNGQQNAPSGQEPRLTVGVRASGNISGTVYVVVTDSGRAFAGQAINATGGGQGNFSATLTADASLPPGVYTGRLSVNVCRDALCINPFAVSGGGLPYTVTIVPKVAVEVYVAGALVSTTAGTLDPVAKDTPVEIRSNVAVTVTFAGTDFVLDPSSTSTDWKAVLTAQPGLTAQSTLIVRTIDATQSFQPPVFIFVPFAAVPP